MAEIFRANDIRGLYLSEINKALAFKVGEALANIFADGIVVIAHDARRGAKVLTEALVEGFQRGWKEQRKIHALKIIGLATTPMFYFFVNRFKASGGVMVTASHNPPEYNGFKIVKEGAVVLSPAIIKESIRN
ncbi:MAG: hypothetical protein A3D52_00195 [Candidatus Taylorbacteria bacterium RIFCSPHIGHO2_02_FULL_44_36]|uniref:Alpha-D-phosphohexomutase alpha/beta/alpha domain-containing protein n=1 Tax=Candidatus Taylorbacteria bacterium RIFCSPLOWO2_12_FULL_44_15c TaxID=1802333 RepID=A0A1G2P483_9BACT|nr:MAG: hypothetical protein A3D52_00195 [Candidatus Taylorbacteria bacterium RIFCSPHIGHO2_02_FULL_44_36]OHA38160.1 MAG: hypothetical protein A3I97_01980 [Candidatus Taylorbacteria bacterium RIFCSPLOWO2_02_FULL_44_35]OHA43155.1 MAG: hypothetical protein A3G03_00330 [Candidatus Taylorbacteria bacterium RIFCSPLOWO2_12_FULL_44_15c]